MRYFLDTTFAIDYLRGDPGTVRRFARMLEDGDEPYVNDVVLCELAVGVVIEEDAVFSAFVRSISFVQPGPEAALRAGTWRRDAQRRGRSLSLSDALIAAAADALGAIVLTRNRRDFALAPVPVSDY